MIKLTSTQLRKIIKEEVAAATSSNDFLADASEEIYAGQDKIFNDVSKKYEEMLRGKFVRGIDRRKGEFSGILVSLSFKEDYDMLTAAVKLRDGTTWVNTYQLCMLPQDNRG